jgi:L-threonylcarbamoyladenylate synthase
MHRRHYSPKTPLVIAAHPPAAPNVAWVWWNRNAPSQRSVRMPPRMEEYAARLYETLHTLDREGCDVIAVEPVPVGIEWEGVRDRLRRAADSSKAGDRVI